MTTEEKFDAAVNVIRSLPKDGKSVLFFSLSQYFGNILEKDFNVFWCLLQEFNHENLGKLYKSLKVMKIPEKSVVLTNNSKWYWFHLKDFKSILIKLNICVSVCPYIGQKAIELKKKLFFWV